ncbi:hypothetical protein CMO96_01485 [Candidatus Woesebacteria bacterium]|nr:hypothetical protein [Candidatus Woesebacteria bacterium]
MTIEGDIKPSSGRFTNKRLMSQRVGEILTSEERSDLWRKLDERRVQQGPLCDYFQTFTTGRGHFV